MKINQIPFFKSIPESVIKQGIEQQLIIHKSIVSGTIFIFEEDYCAELTLIIEGTLEAIQIDEQGKQFTINRFTRHSIIGTSLMYSSMPIYLMTIIAITDAKLLIIKKPFVELCLNYSSFMHNFITMVSDQTIFLGSKIKTQINTTIREKIVHLLKNEFDRQKSSEIFLLESKKVIAEGFGVARTSLSRELKFMEKEHLIKVNGKKIKLLDIRKQFPFSL